jgi:hypothetical protein
MFWWDAKSCAKILELYALRYARKSLDYYTLYYLKRPTEGLRLERLSKEAYQLVGAKLAAGEKSSGLRASNRGTMFPSPTGIDGL